MNERILARIHDKWLEPPEPRVVGRCDTCLDGITEGEDILICENGDVIHEDCKGDWIDENVHFERRQAQ